MTHTVPKKYYFNFTPQSGFSRMLRISKIVDYGILVLTHMAQRPSRVCSATELAAALGLGRPMVSKILKLLAQHELVASTRGARGGYRLGREAAFINIAQIIDALEEQPFGLTECTAVPGVCSVEGVCHVRPYWQRINQIVRRTLESVTIADMVAGEPVEPIFVEEGALSVQSSLPNWSLSK